MLSSSFHFGFNQGFNVAEAVNFAMREWVPHGRRARACVCGDGQTPHVSVTSLLRAVKAAEPGAADWWFFECRCGHPATGVGPIVLPPASVAAALARLYPLACKHRCGRHTGASNLDWETDADQPEGELFECSGCGSWGHLGCYPHYASRQRAEEEAGEAAAGEAAAGSEAAMHCVRCTDAWRDREQAGWRLQPAACQAATLGAPGGNPVYPGCSPTCRVQEEWSFSCVCGRHEGATAHSFEAPSGRMFECHAAQR